MKNLIKKIALTGLGILALSGCGEKEPTKEIKSKFKGYDVKIFYNQHTRLISVSEDSSDNIIYGRDWITQEKDSKFNEIRIKVQKGHDLEKYAYPDSLEMIYDKVLEASQ